MSACTNSIPKSIAKSVEVGMDRDNVEESYVTVLSYPSGPYRVAAMVYSMVEDRYIPTMKSGPLKSRDTAEKQAAEVGVEMGLEVRL